MNPFLNPVTSLPFIKNYFTDPGRLWRYDGEKMRRYRDKMLRKTLLYADTVPVYHKKFKEVGVSVDDIGGIQDIGRLPLMGKKDFIEQFPDGVVPAGYDKSKGYVATTSGSTGKPVSIYTDFETMSKAICLFFREGRVYGYNWRKVRFVSIGNFGRGRIDRVYDEGLVAKAERFRRSDKYARMNAYDPIKQIVGQLNEFRPEVILSYPITFQHLAYFKKKGFADRVNPKLLNSGGYTLDEYTRRYVEDAFECPVRNVYSSVESGSTIAFECLEGSWHINHDFFHLETVDKRLEPVDFGEKGHVVLTRMFGRGTPIVRYIGMDDWIALEPEFECECGLKTPVIMGGVQGRVSTRIILPDGRVFPSESFAYVSTILNELKTFKVKQFQIIQKKLDEIEILLVIDDDLRDAPPTVEVIFKKIQQFYEKKVGPEVSIVVKEVDEIKSPPGKPLPLVVSHVKLEDGYKVLES